MKKTSKTLIALGALALVFAARPATASTDKAESPAAQASAALNYGVLDLRAAMMNSNIGKTLNKEISDKMKEDQARVKRDKSKVDGMRKELAEYQKTAKPEDFNKKFESLNTKARSMQEETIKRDDMLNKAAGAALAELQEQVRAAAAEVAKQKGLAAVFPRDAVVVAEERTSITGEVVDFLNKHGKKITVNWTGGKKK
ncbi:MAG: hypothetical protein GC185_11405 [Alphaproteobacteria bacterium]|nr:hypothetical protein [Alphaproteobacteria bacterium]